MITAKMKAENADWRRFRMTVRARAVPADPAGGGALSAGRSMATAGVCVSEAVAVVVMERAAGDAEACGSAGAATVGLPAARTPTVRAAVRRPRRRRNRMGRLLKGCPKRGARVAGAFPAVY